jgi:Flp pilus assembly protein TadB
MSIVSGIAALLFLCVGIFTMRGQRRRAADVLDDLYDEELSASSKRGTKRSMVDQESKSVLPKHFIQRVSNDEAAPFSVVKVPTFVAAALAIALALVTGAGISLVFYGFVGLCVGYLFGQSRYRAKQERVIEEMEQMLPIVMERLVMAVQSGLDVTAGIQSLIRIERKNVGEHGSVDIVTELLELVIQLTESGISFNQSLRDVAEAVPCTALKHSFVHLAVAYEEGGELVSPLRELSDSTQLYYQEVVEERIAKLPVKATMPLVFTFAGLILFFITTPLLQVMELLNDVQFQ